MSIFLSFCKASRMRRGKDELRRQPKTESGSLCSRFPFHRLTVACALNGAAVIF